jgi:hypothetical protein
MVLPGQRPAATTGDADDAALTHDPLDPLAVDPPATPAQLGRHPWGAVRALVLGVDGADLGGELVLGIGACLPGGLGGQPLVVALPTLHRQDAAQPRDAVDGVVFEK